MWAPSLNISCVNTTALDLMMSMTMSQSSTSSIENRTIKGGYQNSQSLYLGDACLIRYNTWSIVSPTAVKVG
jgi:hypothetical protein